MPTEVEQVPGATVTSSGGPSAESDAEKECDLASWDPASASPQVILAADNAKAFIKRHNEAAQLASQVNLVPPVPGQVASDMSAASPGRVYVGNVYYELTEADILSTFSAIGPVRSVQMFRDTTTNRSKGYCFVEYGNVEDAHQAIASLNGMLLMGRAIKVAIPSGGPGGAPLDPLAPNTAGDPPSAPTGAAGALLLAQQINARLGTPAAGAGGQASLSLEGLPPGPEGAAMLAQRINARLQALPGGAAAGVTGGAVPAKQLWRVFVGGVNYDLTSDDIKTVFDPFGPISRVSLIPHAETGKHRGYGFVDFETEEGAMSAIEGMNGFELAGAPLKVELAKGGAPTGTAAAAPVSAIAPSTLATAAAAGTTGENANDRTALMQKLFHSDVKESRCLVLRNMVGPDEVDDELKDEVAGECQQYGQVDKVVLHVDPTSTIAETAVAVFVLFSAATQVDKAIAALDNRWFGGRIIRALRYDESKFQAGELS